MTCNGPRSRMTASLDLSDRSSINPFATASAAFDLSASPNTRRSEEYTSELQSRQYLVCRLLLEKKKNSNILFFFFNDTATTEIYTLSLHDALPISKRREREGSVMTENDDVQWTEIKDDGFIGFVGPIFHQPFRDGIGRFRFVGEPKHKKIGRVHV